MKGWQIELTGTMGANRFFKLGGLELDSRGAQTFLKPPPPVHIQAPPILGGLDINWGLKNIQAP